MYKIPIYFRSKLKRRFNENLLIYTEGVVRRIDGQCPLCKVYRKLGYCQLCPFVTGHNCAHFVVANVKKDYTDGKILIKLNLDGFSIPNASMEEGKKMIISLKKNAKKQIRWTFGRESLRLYFKDFVSFVEKLMDWISYDIPARYT